MAVVRGSANAPYDNIDWRLIAPVFAIVAIDSMGMGVILPLLPFYAERFGATPLFVGMLFAAFSLCQFVAGPILGGWSDRWGRKPILICSQLGTCISFILLAVANSLLLVFLARILDGLTSGNLSVASALAIDHSTPVTRKQAIGIVSSGVGLGLAAGPALSAVSAHFAPSAPIWLAAILSATSLLATTILLPAGDVKRVPRKPPGATDKALLASPAILALLGLCSLFYLAFAMVLSGLALFLAARFNWAGRPFGVTEIGVIFTGTGLINIFVQLVLMKHVGRLLTDKQITIASFVLMAVGYATTGMTQAIALLGLAMVAAAFGSSLLRPTLTSVLSLSAPAHRQGAVLGINQSLMATANTVAPVLGGFLLDLAREVGAGIP